MSDIKSALNLLNESLTTLEKCLSLGLLVETDLDKETILACQDTVIERFAFCYDQFIFFLKAKFQAKFKNLAKPESIFQACLDLSFCSKDNVSELFQMQEDRDKIKFSEDISEIRAIAQEIPSYYNLISSLVERIDKLSK